MRGGRISCALSVEFFSTVSIMFILWMCCVTVISFLGFSFKSYITQHKCKKN
jgi:hypothetical protein